MPDLAEYRRKRDFSRTPEPAGKPRGKHGFSFVVQKHAARRLHYDFRLELDGVLLSWAVPKGPSLDPRDKRLAMRTEDHPVEYGGFEGGIPKGEYGGGTVLLWDRGTWEPIGDAREDLRKGKLEFLLHGEKLRGSWTLVRIRGRDARESGKTWLLMKHRDDKVRPAAEYDITADRPESVASGRSMDEIARDRDRVWHSNRSASSEQEAGPAPKRGGRVRRKPRDLPSVPGARRAPLPKQVDAQLATLVNDPPRGDDWLHEMKLDGYRILARMEKRKARLWSRNAKDWTERFPVALDKFLEGLAVGKAENKEGKYDEFWAKYGQWTRVNSDRGDIIGMRHAFYLEKMLDYLQPLKSKDPKRLYGEVERTVLFYRQNKRCAGCDGPADWDDIEVHHVEEHSAGGPTNLENGAVVHKSCHPKGVEQTTAFAAKWAARKEAAAATDTSGLKFTL